MPYLKIETNYKIDQTKKEQIVLEASKLLSQALNKPENYIMVSINDSTMCFAGNLEPTIYMELKSIGLSKESCPKLSNFLCSFANEVLSIKKDRVYIEFTNIDGSMWGWNDRTF